MKKIFVILLFLISSNAFAQAYMGGEFGVSFLKSRIISESNTAGNFGFLAGFRFAESYQVDFSGNLYLDGDMDVTHANVPSTYSLSGGTLGFGLRYVFAPVSFGFGFIYSLFEEEIKNKSTEQVLAAKDESDKSYYLVAGMMIPGAWIGFPIFDVFIDTKLLGSNDVHKSSLQLTLGFITFL